MMDKMSMFEFVCYDNGDVAGEEYIVASTQIRAEEILKEQFAKDELTFEEFEKIETNKMDSRKSIKFAFAEKPIKVSEYLDKKNHEHYVGSTAPEMGHIDYMMESKRIHNGFEEMGTIYNNMPVSLEE